MAIDPQFEANREKVGEENGVAVWGPVDPPEKHGIHGTHVAVDFDICLADGACLAHEIAPARPWGRPRTALAFVGRATPRSSRRGGSGLGSGLGLG